MISEDVEKIKALETLVKAQADLITLKIQMLGQLEELIRRMEKHADIARKLIQAQHEEIVMLKRALKFDEIRRG